MTTAFRNITATALLAIGAATSAGGLAGAFNNHASVPSFEAAAESGYAKSKNHAAASPAEQEAYRDYRLIAGGTAMIGMGLIFGLPLSRRRSPKPR
jgi:hypothetical protein